MGETTPGWPAMSIAEAHARLTAPGSRFEMEEVEIRGVRTRVWKNIPPTLRAIVEQGRRHLGRDFIVYEDERVTYDAFLAALSAFAHELVAQGVGKGDRVAVAMRNLPEWLLTFYAAASIGAIATPLNAWWTGEELVFGLTDCGARVAVVDAERYARIAGRLDELPDLARLYVCRGEAPLAEGKAQALEAVLGPTAAWGELPLRDLPPADLAPDDPAILFYTSGTTGRPKGVLSSHRGMNSSIGTLGAALARTYLRRGETPPEPAPDAPQRAVLVSVPLFHAAGSHSSMNGTFAMGGKIVLLRKWDPERGCELIVREGVNMAGGVVATTWQLVEHPGRDAHDLSRIDLISYGGAPCPPELLRRLKLAFPQAVIRQNWGMTETNASVTTNIGEDFVNLPESCGPAAATAEVQIRDPEDGVTVLPVGAAGEIWAKGPMTAIGYWNRPEATAETFVDGWVRTGDLGRLDAEGFCYILDRAKDMLIRGGENISCAEVENVLYNHPAVAEAAVVGLPHRVLGEEPAAVVRLRPGMAASEGELRAHVAGQLAAFKAPVRVLVTSEALPRNPTGKILKPEVRKLLADAGVAA